MRRYKGLKRRRRPLKIRQQVVATQKQFIRGVILLLGITLLIIFVFGDHGLLQLYKMKRERATVQAHIVQLRKEREKVTAEKNRLENDLQYIEKLARERYRMVKPGEKVYKVISKKTENQKPRRKKTFSPSVISEIHRNSIFFGDSSKSNTRSTSTASLSSSPYTTVLILSNGFNSP